MNRSREYAEVLLEKARGDLYVLERLAADTDAPTWSLGQPISMRGEGARGGKASDTVF